MEGLNVINCGANVRNTGVCDCFFDPKLIEGAILVPKNKVFTEDELSDANIAATLQAAVAAAKDSRIFPIWDFRQVTDNSEDDVIQTFGYGSQTDVREGKYNWMFQFVNGGLNLSNALRSFNGLTGKYRVVFIDLDSNTIIGTSRKDANGENGLGGIPLERLKTAKWKIADGTNTTIYGINFSFAARYINELIAYKSVSRDSLILSDIVGLEEIKLQILVVGEDYLEVKAISDCGSTDLYELYRDNLSNDAAWVYKDADGNTQTVDNVALASSGDAWQINLSVDVEDGGTIELAAPSVLAADPINLSGYDSVPAVINTGS